MMMMMVLLQMVTFCLLQHGRWASIIPTHVCTVVFWADVSSSVVFVVVLNRHSPRLPYKYNKLRSWVTSGQRTYHISHHHIASRKNIVSPKTVILGGGPCLHLLGTGWSSRACWCSIAIYRAAENLSRSTLWDVVYWLLFTCWHNNFHQHIPMNIETHK